ncbi:MAG: glycosyltransferase family 4 protein [Bacteroidota bacterium]
MKILFLTDNFPPEYNAPATRTYEHCLEWVKQGADVTVITCFPNFPQGKVFEGYKNKWKQRETIHGIKVIRVWSFISQNAGFVKRTLDFLSFAVTSFFAGLFVKCDTIVATSPQFFTAVSGCMLGFVKRKKWVMEVRDIWPESIKAVEAVQSGWIISLLERVELFLYRHASKIVVVTDSFKVNLTSRGVRPDKIFVIKNGVDLSIYSPRERDARLINQLNLHNKIVVGYIGTHGLAHGLDFIMRSVKKLHDDDFHFLFIGDGAEKQNVIDLSKELNLTNVSFIDPVKKSEIPSYLSIIDISLVPLRKSTTFQSVIPSKIFEAVAMGKPIFLGVDGETRGIIEFYQSGIYFEPENETEFVEKLQLMKRKLKEDPSSFASGCAAMAQDFDRTLLAQKMLNIISN